MDFEKALSIVLKHEGGYANHPADPGGETMYGITKRVAMEHGYSGPMRQIPMQLVQDIYHRSYWLAGKCDQLPPELRLIHFDSCVNSGVGRAAKWLQGAVGASQDGVIGPLTLAAASEAVDALPRYAAIRLKFLTGLSAFGVFGRGWTGRVADVLERSMA